MQGVLQNQIRAGKISELILGMWLHSVDHKKADAVEMKALVKSPVYAKVDPGYHRLAANEWYFGQIALTPALGATDSRYGIPGTRTDIDIIGKIR